MPRIVKPEVAGDLTQLLPVLEPRSLSPDEVSSTLQLTQPLLPGTHKMRGVVRGVAAGPVGVTVVGPTAGPDLDHYWYIISIALFDSEAVAKSYHIHLLDSIGVNSTPIANAIGVTVPINIAALVAPRAFILPPKFTMGARSSLQNAGQSLTLVWVYVEHLIMDPHPNI